MNYQTRRSVLATFAAALLPATVAFSATPAAAQVQIQIREIPAPIVEVVPAVPHPGWSWVPGHWVWRGGWVWIRGHYIAGVVPPMPAAIVETPPAAPGPRFFWVRGHYVWEFGGWRWHPGVWVRA
jgi:hypothetical protein